MKITKGQLRRLIKEELVRVLGESNGDLPHPVEPGAMLFSTDALNRFRARHHPAHGEGLDAAEPHGVIAQASTLMCRGANALTRALLNLPRHVGLEPLNPEAEAAWPDLPHVQAARWRAVSTWMAGQEDMDGSLPNCAFELGKAEAEADFAKLATTT